MILSRYIGKTIIYSTLVILLILVGLQSFFLLIAEAADIGKGNYHVLQSLIFVAMELPLSIYQFFPMAGLLGSLIGLSRLSSTCELTIMRSSGVSILGISWSVIKAAILLLVIVTFIGEGVAYPLSQKATNYKNQAVNKSNTSQNPLSNVWLRHNHDYIHIAQVVSDKKILGLTRYHLSAQQKLISAETATSATKTGPSSWLWNNLQQTDFSETGTTAEAIAQKSIPMQLDLKLLGYINTTPNQLSLQQLWDVGQFDQAAGLDNHQIYFSFWQRTLQPLATLIMIMLGIPFVFGSLREVSISARIITGISVGFLFYIINQFIGPMSLVYQVPPFLAALTPTALFFIVYLYLTTRLRR